MAVVVAALLLAGGCDDDRHVTFPDSGAGTIEGWVSDGLPFDPRTVVISVSDYRRNDIDFTIRVQPDSSGHYAVVVPNGPARVSLSTNCGREIFYRRSGLTHNGNAADSVMVADETCRVDFPCGRVAVDVGMPPEYQDRSIHCGLQEPGTNPRNYAGCNVAYEERFITELRFVKPGDYRLVLQDSYFGYAYLPATLDSTEAEWVTVRAGEVTPHVSEIPALTVLAGTVTGSWQAFGFSPPRIEVWREGVPLEDYLVGADGSFEVRLLAGGPLKILVSTQDMTGYVGGFDLDSATLFDVATGEHRTGIAHAESGLELTLAGDYDPTQPDVRFEVFDSAGHRLLNRPDSGYTHVVNVNPLRICNLPPGEVRIAVRPYDMMPIWRGQYFDRRESLETADPVTVPAGGQIVQTTMTVERGASLRGHLLAADGDPFPQPRVEVNVYAADDNGTPIAYYPSHLEGLYNTGSGEYVLNQLPGGAYKLRARYDYGEYSWYPGVLSSDDAGVVVVEDHAEVVLEDWQQPD